MLPEPEVAITAAVCERSKQLNYLMRKELFQCLLKTTSKNLVLLLRGVLAIYFTIVSHQVGLFNEALHI